MPRSSMLPEFVHEKVVADIMAALPRCGYEATVADLVIATGIPARRVEAALDALSERYSGSQRVTETGVILYSFQDAFSESPPLADLGPRLGRKTRGAVESLIRSLRNGWPIALMGGYFTVFLALPFPPALIALAVLLGTWSDLDYAELAEDNRTKQRGRVRRLPETLRAYLFGTEGEPSRLKENGLTDVLSFARGHQGILSSREVMELAGYAPEEAREYLHELLIAYSGEPMVTESGAVVYRFPELMKTVPARKSVFSPDPLQSAGEALEADADSGSKRRTRILSLTNYANFLFAIYYGGLSLKAIATGGTSALAAGQAHPGASLLFDATYSLLLGAHLASPLPTMLVALGIVPFGIATAFLVLHRLALRRKAFGRRAIEERRLRREVYTQVFRQPRAVDPRKIRVRRGAGAPQDSSKVVGRILDELASIYDAEIEDTGEGYYIYHFAELEQEEFDLDRLRDSIDPSDFDVGRFVFDSRERID